MITADTITDEQIHELLNEVSEASGTNALCREWEVEWLDDIERICESALSPRQGQHYVTARARCAEILQARGGK